MTSDTLPTTTSSLLLSVMSTPTTNTAAIVGGIVGGVVLIVAIIAVVTCYMRQRGVGVAEKQTTIAVASEYSRVTVDAYKETTLGNDLDEKKYCQTSLTAAL